MYGEILRYGTHYGLRIYLWHGITGARKDNKLEMKENDCDSCDILQKVIRPAQDT